MLSKIAFRCFVSKTTEFNLTSSRKFHEDAVNYKQKLSESYLSQDWRFQFFFAPHKVGLSCDNSEPDKVTRQVNFFTVNFSILNTPDICQGSGGAHARRSVMRYSLAM